MLPTACPESEPPSIVFGTIRCDGPLTINGTLTITESGAA